MGIDGRGPRAWVDERGDDFFALLEKVIVGAGVGEFVFAAVEAGVDG